MDPDPGGPKTWGSGSGSGSPTLIFTSIAADFTFLIKLWPDYMEKNGKVCNLSGAFITLNLPKSYTYVFQISVPF
jgi:hypothetical protein